jgi:hypothetical protein
VQTRMWGGELTLAGPPGRQLDLPRDLPQVSHREGAMAIAEGQLSLSKAGSSRWGVGC